jgi:hypothetical protein
MKGGLVTDYREIFVRIKLHVQDVTNTASN